jgi:hypothetical protein
MADEIPVEKTEEVPVEETSVPVTPAGEAPADLSAVTDFAAIERERCKKIRALVDLAGVPDKFNLFVDNNFSVEETQAALRDIVAKKNPALSNVPEAAADPNAKYKAEFAAEPAYSKSMTVDQFVAMRRVDEGLDVLKTPMNVSG